MAAPRIVGIDATTWWNDRGYGRFTREIVSALAARDEGFRYVLFADREPDASLPPGVEVQVIPTRRTLEQSAVGEGARSPLDLLALGRGVARMRWDLLFFPSVYSYYPVPRRGACVLAIHDAIPERHPELVFPTRRNRMLWRAKMTLALRQATRVMTVSEASARDIAALLGVSRERIDVVSEGADVRFRRLEERDAVASVVGRYGLGAERPYLVYVGGLNPHKNLLGLLRALLVAKAEELALAVVGDTSGQGFYDNVAELRAFVDARPELARRVVFTGFVPDADLVALYNGALAFVSPSLGEGFGLPALEAMACGLPVLASDRGSLPEVVGEAGLFFDPEQPDAIARVIDALALEPARRQELAGAARRRAASFSWERGAREAEACFRRALGEAAP